MTLKVIKRCIDAGWTSVMFDGSAMPFQQNLGKSLEVYKLTEAAGIGLEAEMGAIGGVEDDKFVAEDKALLANFDECVAFCKEMPKLAVFAPAIGTAHGFYKGEPKIAYDLLEDHRCGRYPDCASRRNGAQPGAVRPLHRGGLRQGQHLDHAQALLHRRFRQTETGEAEARGAIAVHPEPV